MTIELHYTEAMFRRAIFAFFRRTFLKRIIWPWLLLVGIAAVLFYVGPKWIAAATITAFVVIPFMMALSYWMHVRRSLQRYALLEDGNAKLTVNEDGTIFESAMGRSESKWKIYTDLWSLPEFYLLFYGESQFITLPKDQVPDEFIQFIRQKLPAKA